MHRVDRGTEPSGLGDVRQHYTPRWVQYYKNGSGAKPTDSRWRDFRDELGQRFSVLCGYCECFCRGEVDHFQPKSHFPELVYEWSNWIFACHDCNQAKRDEWPVEGYVDPCAVSESHRPETYFTFNTKTGTIVPLKGLDSDRRDKALKMIKDFKLNGEHHLRKRRFWIWKVSRVLPDDPSQETPETEVYRRFLTSRTAELSSITRAWLVERGYSISS